MSMRRESLPSTAVARIASRCPGSRKVYVAGPARDARPVPRDRAVADARDAAASTEMNPPFRVYDTSGPYTDPAVAIDLDARPAGAAAALDPGARASTTAVAPRRGERARPRPDAAAGGPARARQRDADALREEGRS